MERLEEFTGKLEALPGGYVYSSAAELKRLVRMIDFAVTNGRRLREQLAQLVHHGPLWDGDVISKSDRTELLYVGAAAKIWVNGKDGYQAATYTGGQLLKIIDAIYPRPATEGETDAT